MESFLPTLLGTKVIVYTKRASIRYLISNKKAKLWLFLPIFLLQEFDFDVNDGKRYNYQEVDYLSHLEFNNEKLGKIDINDTFPNEFVMTLLGGLES